MVIARDPDLRNAVATVDAGEARFVGLAETLPNGAYYWGVRSSANGETVLNEGGARTFRIDSGCDRPYFCLGDNALVAASRLHGDAAPRHGILDHQRALEAVEGHTGEPGGAMAFDGVQSELRFAVPWFPEEDYSFTAWVQPQDTTSGGYQQVFSAWCAGGDDPLRVTVEHGELSARIESRMGNVRTAGAAVEAGTWVHVAAVKKGETLTLYVNGAVAGTTHAPARVVSRAQHVGVGYNPILPGGEHFRGHIEDLAFYAGALTPAQIREALDHHSL